MMDAETILEEFAVRLARVFAESGMRLEREYASHTDRTFRVTRDTAQLWFVAKVSTSPNGFWGLTDSKARELLNAQGHLLLLNGPATGYWIGPESFR